MTAYGSGIGGPATSWTSLKAGLTPDNEMTRRLYRVLLKWVRYADTQFAEWADRPDCGHFFGGAYWYGIETAYSAVVFAVVGTMGEFDDTIAGQSRQSVKDKAIRAIRYLCYTHDTGPEECVRTTSRNPCCSGKKWGGRGDGFFRASQTGTVVHALGCAAWLLHDELDGETKALVEAVLEYYADIWSVEEPRNGVYFDTQCEENGWTAAGIGTAAALLPGNPRQEQWRKAALRWSLNSVTMPEDRVRRVPGVSTVTFHPDYTAENHAFVHPSYMMAGIQLRGLYALLELMADRDIPSELTSNNVPMYASTIKPWSGVDGIPVPVQGQDWWYNLQHASLSCHAFMNVLHGDEDAARLERAALGFVEGLQDSNGKGCLLEENGEACIVVAESYQTAKDMEFGSAHSLLIAYLLHRFGGGGAVPSTDRDWSARTNGVHYYPHGGTIVHKTDRAFSSFSWRSHVMAVTLPAKSMWGVTPLYASHTGETEFEGETPGYVYNETKSVVCTGHRITRLEDGFGATAEIERGKGAKLLHRVAFVSLPDGRSFYAERIRANAPCAVKSLSTGIIGIRNERYGALGGYADGTKTVKAPRLTRTYEGFYGKEPNVRDSFGPLPYVNINDEIGYVLFGSEDVTYLNQHEYPKWKGVEDVLTLNDRGAKRFEGLAELPVFAMLTLPDASAEQTAGAAERSRLLTGNEDGCIAAETDGYLIVANLSGRRTEFEASYAEAGSSIQLFEGMQRWNGGEVTRTGSFEPGYAGFAASRFRLELPSSGGHTHDLAVVVSSNRVYVTDQSGSGISKVSVIDPVAGKRTEAGIEPSGTLVLIF
ncbi:hypothetical protein FE784_36660 [Paenibacillus hemerocallicola]|uniref:Uncharacterized protein n=1 Tax=Paenibacillus hemerocallicola TaxID=1172614 RepID=A0A5C4SXU6_9BACL|nr:hypothetical protein [Paenibacillus hemerocallicola]TNJ60018.1 hypothetical protein FE784_36660 [Paenibacillus hemerocallicola]